MPVEEWKWNESKINKKRAKSDKNCYFFFLLSFSHEFRIFFSSNSFLLYLLPTLHLCIRKKNPHQPNPEKLPAPRVEKKKRYKYDTCEIMSRNCTQPDGKCLNFLRYLVCCHRHTISRRWQSEEQNNEEKCEDIDGGREGNRHIVRNKKFVNGRKRESIRKW